jgi:hypothetical protein
MRAAVIVVLMLVLTAPSEASKSCMTKSEARRHFALVHIYWHGKDHCWDATSARRHHQIRMVQQIQKVQRKIVLPKWQSAMSEMLPDEEPVPTPLVDRFVDIEPSPLVSPLVSRWVDIAQVVPPPITEPVSMVSLRGVLIVIIIVIGLPLAIVGVLFGGSRSKLDTVIVFGSKLDHDR